MPTFFEKIVEPAFETFFELDWPHLQNFRIGWPRLKNFFRNARQIGRPEIKIYLAN